MTYILSSLTGLLLSLSAPPLEGWPLVWGALIPLFIAVRGARSYRRAAAVGALAGLIFHGFLFLGVLPSFSWVYFLLLPLYCVPFVCLCLLASFLDRRSLHPVAAAAVLAASWVVIENAMNAVSVPYCLAPILYRSAWAQAASVIGGSGLGALIVGANALAASLLREALRTPRPWRRLTGMTLAWVVAVWVPFAYGRWVLENAPASGASFPIAIVQPNWGPEAYVGKEQEALWRELHRLIKDASERTTADALIFPETFGLYLNQGRYLAGLEDVRPVDIVIGGLGHSPDRRLIYNAAYHLRPGRGIVAVYRKAGLVPLVESAYAAGRNEAQAFAIGGVRLAPLICFESLITRRVEGQAAAGDGLLLLANEAWFPQDALPAMHLASMVLHAIEYGRPAAMAGNTVSMVSDARGRFQVTPFRRAGVATLELHLGRVETPFRRFGPAVPAIAGLVVIGIVLKRRTFP